MAATVSRIRRVALDLALVAFAVSRAGAVGGSAVRQRIAADAGSGVPLVAHVIVALCDKSSRCPRGSGTVRIRGRTCRFAGGTSDDVREAAARAYDRYQTCGLTAARQLFAVEP